MKIRNDVIEKDWRNNQEKTVMNKEWIVPVFGNNIYRWIRKTNETRLYNEEKMEEKKEESIC